MKHRRTLLAFVAIAVALVGVVTWRLVAPAPDAPGLVTFPVTTEDGRDLTCVYVAEDDKAALDCFPAR